MQQHQAAFPLLILAGLHLSASLSSAAPVTLDAVNRGYFRSDGRHITGQINTYTGYASLTPRRYNSFFVFDLTGLSGTVGTPTLFLELEQYLGPYSTLTFDVYDVSATAAELDATYIQPDAAGTAIHNDLGSGNIYASQTVTAANVGSVLNIPLSALAQSTIESQLNTFFAVGVYLQGPDSGDYNVRFGDDMLETIQLEFELTPLPVVNTPNPIPEPATLLLLSCLLMGLVRRPRLLGQKMN